MTPLSVLTFIVVFSLYISKKQCYDFRIFTNSFGHRVPYQWGFPCLTSNNLMDCSVVPSGFVLDAIMKNANKDVQDKILGQLYRLGQYYNPSEPGTNRLLSPLNHQIPLHGLYNKPFEPRTNQLLSPLDHLKQVYSSPYQNLLALNSMPKFGNTRPLLGKLNGPTMQDYRSAAKMITIPVTAKYDVKLNTSKNNIYTVTLNDNIYMNATKVSPMALEHRINVTSLKVTEIPTTEERDNTTSMFQIDNSPKSTKDEYQPSIPSIVKFINTSKVTTKPMFQEYNNNLTTSKVAKNAVTVKFQNNFNVSYKPISPGVKPYVSNAHMTEISPVPSEHNINASIPIMPTSTTTSENHNNPYATLDTRRVAAEYNLRTPKLTPIYQDNTANIAVESSTSDSTFLITTFESEKVENITEETAKLIRIAPGFSDNQTLSKQNISLFETFLLKLEGLDRKFYKASFTKLLNVSPKDRRENGISFAQSGLLLYLMLLAVSTEVDPDTRSEIDDCIDFIGSDTDRLQLMKRVESWLPTPTEELKLRWSTRLALFPPMTVSRNFEIIGQSIKLNISHFNGTESPEVLANTLNHMIELDSGGAMHDTFEDEELSGHVRGVLMSIAYMRGRWRSAPTLLNGTRPFHDANAAPQRTVRMIRINDVMRYADLNECDAEAVEISYATDGLSLLMLIPRGESLRSLAEKLTEVGVNSISRRMYSVRVAATIPLYTLRMTLLLPSKLRDMGINRLVTVSNSTGEPQGLVLSHAIQRLMFWSEAGRNAFKDDGMEWDEAPEMELVVDRPYLFFVRWHNVTLMNGNFVL